MPICCGKSFVTFKTTNMLHVKESSVIGQEVLNEQQSIIIGISINNSYFKEENLLRLISWGSTRAQSVAIMIPDLPAISTLMALGMPEDKARREARKKANNLENKCRAIIERLSLQDISIVRWESIVGNINYLQALIAIKEAYDQDDLFRIALRSTTEEVIAAHMHETPSASRIDTGVQFLLQELAFICRSPKIIRQEKVAYVYHHTMQVMKDIMEDKYSFKAPSVGFITAE